jgi:hypothetical protein
MTDSTHLDPLALVRHVCEPGARVDPELARHLERCPSCADEVRRLQMVRGALTVGEAEGEPGPECLGDDALAAIAAGELEGASRSEIMMHLASCGHCRSTVASLARVLADPTVAAERGAADRTRKRWLARLAVPAAAAAILLIAVLGTQGDGDPPSAIHRAPETTADGEPVPISPRGPGDRPATLRWGAVAGADLYRVTLFQADGRALYQLEVRDTVTGLPDSIRLSTGRSYLWKVEARTDWDRWTSSRMVDFSVGTAQQ